MTAGIIGSVLLAIIGYLVQIAVFPAIGGVAVAPNMMLALAVVFGMVYGPWPALAMGLFGGLMVDFMAGGAIGLSSFIPVIAGIFVGSVKARAQQQALFVGDDICGNCQYDKRFMADAYNVFCKDECFHWLGDDFEGHFFSSGNRDSRRTCVFDSRRAFENRRKALRASLFGEILI